MTRTLAFPGAEGYGAGTLGAMASGAGTPSVYRVTNTNDSGAGSLRAALEASGARFVVFDTGGTITLSTPIIMRNPYCTILGHTAPADSGGITLKNGGTLNKPPLKIEASEVIVRHIRVRTGTSSIETTGLQSIGIGRSGYVVTNVILDHVSTSWGSDQEITVWFDTRNVTIQWCIAGEALSPATSREKGGSGKGIHLGSGYENAAGNVSVHHCFMAHNTDRNPNIVTDVSYPVEVINCLIYNPEEAASKVRDSYGAEPQVDFVKNAYKAGPNTENDLYEIVAGWTAGGARGSVYVEGNLAFPSPYAGFRRFSDESAETLCTNVATALISGSRLASPTVAVTETNATQAFSDVLESAGCRIPLLDTIDQRMIDDCLNAEGGKMAAGDEDWPTLAAGTDWVRSTYSDDGLPDSYIDVNPGVAWDDINVATEMTELETWAESLVGSVGSAGTGGTSGGTGTETGGGETGYTPTGYTDYVIDRSEDNAYADQDAFYNDELYSVHAGHFSASQYNEWIMLLFRDVQIAQGTTISMASLRLFVPRVDGTAPSLVIVGADEDDAAGLTELADTSRFTTTATVSWTPSADTVMETVETPNIASILTEIIARVGWTPGSNIALAIKPSSATWPGSEQVFHARAFDSGNPPPTLRIATPSAAGGGVVSQSLQVAASGDDGYARSGSTSANATATTIYAGEYSSSFYYYRSFHRFTIGTTISGSASITEATLSLYISGVTGAPTNYNITISAEDTDTAAAPTTAAEIDTDIGGETTAIVSWTPAYADLTINGWNEIDITSVISELHSTHGLDSGDTILILVYATNTSFVENRRINLTSYDGDSSKAAKLDITSSTPSDYLRKRIIGQSIGGSLRSGLSA